jgi:thiamine pyrophosphate-dependent acetolactate synthase large subunit-like protein
MHREEMVAALAFEAEAQRLLLAGEHDQAALAFHAAAERYRSSWELASATSYGRLVGMLKAAILAGGGEEEARYATAQLSGAADSPTAAYARALGALLEGDDEAASRWAAVMRGGADAFERTADAILALGERDRAAYERALQAILRDFEGRTQHLTGVPIADTALMLERLAERRGMRADLESSLLPRM